MSDCETVLDGAADSPGEPSQIGLRRVRATGRELEREHLLDPQRPFLFIQPFDINDLGGGARILRSLLGSAPVPCLSVVTRVRPPQPTFGVEQIHFPTRPYFGRIETTRFGWLPEKLNPVWRVWHRRAMLRLVDKLRPCAIHVVVQPGCDLSAIVAAARAHGVPLAATFHDHPDFYIGKRKLGHDELEVVGEIWRNAKRRFVISPEMGVRLCQDFGAEDYELVTDGVERFGKVKELESKPEYFVYFMGLFHEFYDDNFRSLLQVLQQVADAADKRFTLRVRSNYFPAFDTGPRVRLERLRPSDDATVAREIEHADILYLPLPFSEAGRSFADYSLSTKMISYLASGRPILYHGPATAAAGRLLRENRAAVCATELDESTIGMALTELLCAPRRAHQVATAALALAGTRFHIDAIRSRFWRSLLSMADSTARRGEQSDSISTGQHGAGPTEYK